MKHLFQERILILLLKLKGGSMSISLMDLRVMLIRPILRLEFLRGNGVTMKQEIYSKTPMVSTKNRAEGTN